MSGILKLLGINCLMNRMSVFCPNLPKVFCFFYLRNDNVFIGFPEDDDRATELLHKSVEQGSALGVLVALRTGELSPELEARMPFANLQEAFDAAFSKSANASLPRPVRSL